MPHAIYILFLSALGACVGSFLNVVVWRLPRVKPEEGENLFRAFLRSMHALSEPPSHCPKCEKRLKWYDNIPVLGWIKLGGRCRFCKEPISMRYPIVEAITALLFAGYYWAFFMAQTGPCHNVNQPIFITEYGWLYGLDMVLLSGLLAASLIDAELFIIPLEIPWVIIPIALVVHTVFDQPGHPGNVCVTPLPAALAAGAGVGAVLSMTLLSFGILPASFVDGGPMTEVERDEYVREEAKKQKAAKSKDGRAKGEGPITPPVDEPRDWSPGEIRREIGKEMLFLLLPMALGMIFVMLAWKVEPVAHWWAQVAGQRWVSALLGSVLGGLVGGFTVWITRILGTLGFGRVAMGMGDVDLMVAVGAVLGGGAATASFFLAPFFGILMSIYLLMTRKSREVPDGPYLSLATAVVMLFYCQIAAYFGPNLANVGWMLSRMLGAGGA